MVTLDTWFELYFELELELELGSFQQPFVFPFFFFFCSAGLLSCLFVDVYIYIEKEKETYQTVLFDCFLFVIDMGSTGYYVHVGGYLYRFVFWYISTVNKNNSGLFSFITSNIHL